jgi:alanine dehydrogenase
MPGAVPRTSTLALSNVTLPYIMEVANKGYSKAMKENSEIAKGINLIQGNIVNKAVAQSLGMMHQVIY